MAGVVFRRINPDTAISAPHCEKREPCADGSFGRKCLARTRHVEAVASEELTSTGRSGVSLRAGHSLHGIRFAVACDPAREVHRPIVYHFHNRDSPSKPGHAFQKFGTCLRPCSIRSPTDALQGCRLCGCHNQLIVLGDHLRDAGIDFYSHAELYADLPNTAGFAGAGNVLVIPMSLATKALVSRVAMSSIRECIVVNMGIWIGNERIGDEVAASSLHHKDGRIGPKQYLDVGAVVFERLL